MGLQQPRRGPHQTYGKAVEKMGKRKKISIKSYYYCSLIATSDNVFCNTYTVCSNIKKKKLFRLCFALAFKFGCYIFKVPLYVQTRYRIANVIYGRERLQKCVHQHFVILSFCTYLIDYLKFNPLMFIYLNLLLQFILKLLYINLYYLNPII